MNSRLLKQLSSAESYTQWQNIAHQLDDANGHLQWRQNASDPSPAYRTFTEHWQVLGRQYQTKNWSALIPFLKESLYKHIGELNSARLYQTALSGPKQVVSRYLDLVVEILTCLSSHPVSGFSSAEKLALFRQAEKNFGRPALMLSGGGTFGIYHMGVIKALLQENLLPDVICGTSMGSIAAGILAIHTAEELHTIFQNPEQQHYKPLKPLSLKQAFAHRSLLDPIQLQRCIEANVHDFTFAEAYEKTGREVSITVSPIRPGQKPRILNRQTAPDVLISYASSASCSVPGLFPPVMLKAKQPDGTIIPYLPSERWVDGSFASDIPRQRISRLNNVNFFIVSQANPHVLPFVAHRQRSGAFAFIQDLAVSSMVSQGNTLLKVAKRRLRHQPWQSWLNHGSLLLDQDYLGDINIHPDFPFHWYRKFMKNPSVDELNYLIQLGERSTWPYITMIRDQTRISHTLRDCIARLETAGVEETALNR